MHIYIKQFSVIFKERGRDIQTGRGRDNQREREGERDAVVKIDSSPLVRFYQKFEWASKSICLLAQKVY